MSRCIEKKGYNIHFVDSDAGNAAGNGRTFDLTLDGINADVKRIEGLGRNAISDVAKGVEQVGTGGHVIVVRPENSKFTFEQYQNSLMKIFKPKQPGVTIKMVNESSLPKIGN